MHHECIHAISPKYCRHWYFIHNFWATLLDSYGWEILVIRHTILLALVIKETQFNFPGSLVLLGLASLEKLTKVSGQLHMGLWMLQ